MTRILVPIDFSDRSREALRRADKQACNEEGELNLIFVQAPTQLSFMDFSYATPPDILAEALTKARDHLEDWANELETPSTRIKCDVRVGDTVDELVHASKESDLVVISTHGRRGIAHAVLGSVTERLVQKAACSVLVVR
jgi:nucleotide-binding universal stress UspA family protein